MRNLIPLFEDHSHPQVNEQLEKAKCCPDCGARWFSLVAMTEGRVRNPRYVITCGDCKHHGPFGKGLADAVMRWNKPPTLLAVIIRRWKWKRMRQKQQKLGKPTLNQWRNV